MGRDDAPGIVVLQEWWGVDYEIKNHAVTISELGSGFKALIPEYDVFSLLEYECVFLCNEDVMIYYNWSPLLCYILLINVSFFAI